LFDVDETGDKIFISGCGKSASFAVSTLSIPLFFCLHRPMLIVPAKVAAMFALKTPNPASHRYHIHQFFCRILAAHRLCLRLGRGCRSEIYQLLRKNFT